MTPQLRQKRRKENIMAGKKETPAFFAMQLQRTRADLHRAAKASKSLDEGTKAALAKCDQALDTYRQAVERQEKALADKRQILDL